MWPAADISVCGNHWAMTGTEPTAEDRALGLSILRGMVLLAVAGGVICITFGASALLGYPSILPDLVTIPVFLGACAVMGNSILVLHAQGVGRGGAYLEWMWEYVPKTLLLLIVLAAVFSWQVFEHLPDYPRGSPEARAGMGQQAELFIGFATIFYVYGGAILVGALRAAKD